MSSSRDLPGCAPDYDPRALNGEPCHYNSRHDIRPTSASSGYSGSGGQDRAVAGDVVAGAQPHRAHVVVDYHHKRYSHYRVKSVREGKTLSIGDLGKATGVKVVTIRYYEQIGLMPVAPRTGGNCRACQEEHVRRLRFIRRLRGLGFALVQVRDLLPLASEKNQACAQVDRITSEHLADVEHRIRDLKKLAAELRRLSRRCQGGGRIADCRIIEALLT